MKTVLRGALLPHVQTGPVLGIAWVLVKNAGPQGTTEAQGVRICIFHKTSSDLSAHTSLISAVLGPEENSARETESSVAIFWTGDSRFLICVSSGVSCIGISKHSLLAQFMAHVIAKAKGLAILSVIKAGFLVTARGGSGVVLARLPDGRWSAPSAIGIAGLGGGFEVGIEVSDLVIILNYDRAVEAFAKGGNLTLGGNFTVAVGPLGRNLEGNVALRSPAAVFTYCKSRGLFAGVSLEGSCLIERKDTNRKFYCRDIRAYDILFGDTPRPAQADDLYEILDSFAAKYERDGQRANARRAARERRRPVAKDLPPKPLPSPRPSPARAPLDAGSQSNGNKSKLYPELSSFQERVGLPKPMEVTALYSFEGQQPGDLNFQAGDRITVISKTDSQFDWWEGQLRGQTGIFPANYVAVN